MYKAFFILYLLSLSACRQRGDQETIPPFLISTSPEPVRICLLPLGKTNPSFVAATATDLKKIFKDVVVLPKEEMPLLAYYAPRKRYRADSLINWMRQRAKKGEVYLGITRQDISTTKGTNPDHGIMGLGYRPGNACVASDFRLRNKQSFFKVVIHELGHTAGLPHCPTASCFMRDAEGGDPTGQEKEFCHRCKTFLQQQGWRL